MSKLTPEGTIPILDSGPKTKERIVELEEGAPIVRTKKTSKELPKYLLKMILPPLESFRLEE
ncbi:1950_t:CDS:2 [Cetraspora pellucida]|uniref:1950_t:CDS:1 n=1 Tax=Cetraspora pellucida TaxID=1433469 RepID=A0A9N9ITB8_9GLOM|nr:1950_t:CDS:2 [Cetraspora pellucida]